MSANADTRNYGPVRERSRKRSDRWQRLCNPPRVPEPPIYGRSRKAIDQDRTNAALRGYQRAIEYTIEPAIMPNKSTMTAFK
jgi:hypothetical protein